MRGFQRRFGPARLFAGRADNRREDKSRVRRDRRHGSGDPPGPFPAHAALALSPIRTMNQTPHDTVQHPERLARLRVTGLLDAPTEEAFDRLTRLAAKLLEAPISTVTLVDTDRQFYLSCVGVPEPLASTRETPLEFSFCRHTVVLGRPLVVPDTRNHPIVGENPAIEQFGVHAYAGIPLLTSDGQALGTLCVMDLKVRNWTDDQISSLTDLAAAVSTEIELRLDIAERMRVEQKLQETVRLRDEVLGIVSHDLRNPVHTISLSSGFLLETIPATEAQKPLRQQLAVIRRASERMDRMIGDLLDAASITTGHLSMERRPYPASAILKSACEVLQPLAAEKGLRFACEAAQEEVSLQADPDRVLQVLSNLVGNSVKFTPEGGQITLGFQPDDSEARLWVSDTGAGIDSAQLPHVFEQFWQARRSGRNGVGLGLAIAQGIVEAHDGRIWVESIVGQGTTFSFTIPLAAGAQ